MSHSLLVFSAVFVLGLGGCTAAEPKPANHVAASAPSATDTERLSDTNEKTGVVSEDTMSAPLTKTAPRTENEDAPKGQLVCRTTADGNAHQIYLEWNGDTAKGTLRTSTPSGMVRQEPIKAERYKARIIIDDPNSDDVAIHKATLVEDRKGKHIQLGDHTQRWIDCATE
jgi:hypothetical protein